MKPTICSGRFHAGTDFQCGENVTIDVAEEVILGDRVTLSDHAYLCGRRIVIGDDFYGYSWEWKRLDLGRGRRDEEDAVLTVGARCTFHDNRIDLARRVTIGNDVGLSPEVTIYTHHYWLSPLDGYPCRYEPVTIGSGVIVGYRSTVLPGAAIGEGTVIGAGSVVSGGLMPGAVYGGNPAKRIRDVKAHQLEHQQEAMLGQILHEYERTLEYRFGEGASKGLMAVGYPVIDFCGTRLNVETLTVEGEEDERSDDLRWHLFTHGIRIYSRRPFRKLGRRLCS